MTIHQDFETLGAGADPVLTAAWAGFIREQDARYARLALWRGEPYTTFTDEEVREAATLAAALGVTPADVPTAQDWQPADRADDRIPAAVG